MKQSAETRLTQAQRIFSLFAVSNISEENGHLVPIGITNPKCVNIETSPVQVFSRIHVANRQSGQSDFGVNLDPIRFNIGH